MMLLFVDVFLQALMIIIIIRVIISWVAPNADNFLIIFINNITEPILAPLRSFLTFGAIDFSPLAAIFILELIQRLIHFLL